MGGAAAIINAQIRAQDLASAVVQKFASTTRSAMQGLTTTVTAQTNAFSAANAQYAKNIQRMQQYSQENERVGMSTGRLITMMIKFGIILKALQIATEPLRILGEGIKNLVEIDARTREIMGMLADRTDSSATTLKRYNDIVDQTVKIQTRFGFSVDDIGKGLYNVASVINTLNIKGYAETQSDAITKLTTDAAMLARGGFMPLEEATNGLTTVFNAMNLPLTNVGQVMDIMFNAVKIGKGHMSDLTNNMGSFLSILGDLSTPENALRNFSETMGQFGYLTDIIKPARAGTAISRLLTSIADPTTEEGQLMKSVSSHFGIDLGGAAFSTMGPNAYMQQLVDAIGPTSSRLSGLIQQRTGMAPSAADLAEISTVIMAKLVGDRRGAQAIFAMARPGVLGTIDSTMNQTGTAAMAEEQAMQAYQTRWQIFQENINAVGETLQKQALPKFMGFFDGLAGILADTINTPGYNDMASGGQLGAILGNISHGFEGWFGNKRSAREGTSGSQQIYQTASEWGTNTAKFFADAFGLSLPGEMEKHKSIWWQVGSQAIGGFWQGFSDTLGKALGGGGILDIANNPLARGAAAFFGLMKVGIPWPVALMLALTGAAGATGDLGTTGNVVGGVASAIGALSLAINLKNWAVGKNVGGVQQPGYIQNTVASVRSVGRGIGMAWSRLPDGTMHPPTGWASPYEDSLARDSYGRFLSREETNRQRGFVPPGQIMPSYGPMNLPGGGGIRGRIGRGLGAAGGSFVEGISGILVMEALMQVAETIQLITDNWDKFVFALKRGDLNDIPIFGLFFRLASMITGFIDRFMTPSTPPPSVTSSGEYIPVTGSILDQQLGGRPAAAGSLASQMMNQRSIIIDTMNIHIPIQTPDSLDRVSAEKHANAIYDALVDRLGKEAGNAGNATPIIAP